MNEPRPVPPLRSALLAVAMVLVFAVAALGPAAAQSWPSRPVRILVPYAAGGNTDGNARVISAILSQAFGQQFVVDNRPGANGAIAAELVARSVPDGYTLFMAALPQIAIFPAMTKTTYDPVNDFAPICEVSVNPFVIVVNTKLMPVSTLAEFVSYIKARPGELVYASAGIGSLSQLSMVLFLKAAGLEMQHANYKGGAPALTDVVAGQVPTYFANLSEALPHADNPTVKLLAVSSKARAAQLPNVPTVSESGYPGFETITWNGLLGPARLPKDIIDKIATQIQKDITDPKLVERFHNYGVDPLGAGPNEFARQIKLDIAQWTEAVRISGAKLE
ncbi:MAG TPA: tripartite tricarboxylate transporter substrate binding protein [Alphaproteobacteria bacterium]